MIHPKIENLIFSLFWVETPKIKKIVTKKFYFFMESGEIKSRSPFSTETDTFYCLEVSGLQLLASRGFQAVKCISFCTEGTYFITGGG